MAVKSIPDRYHTVTPYLVVRNVSDLIDFLKQVFEVEELERFHRPDGSITHAEVRIGDSVVMMGEASGDFAPVPVMLHVYLEDSDAAYRRALAAGATSLQEPADQFYGDRTAGVKDAFGNQWWLATHVEDVSPEEMRRRAEALGR
jgi:PhnB protein